MRKNISLVRRDPILLFLSSSFFSFANRRIESLRKKKNLLTQFSGGRRSSTFRDFGPERRIIDLEFFLHIVHLCVHFLSNLTSRSSTFFTFQFRRSEFKYRVGRERNGTEEKNGKRETMEKNMIFFAKNLNIFRKHTPGKRTENDWVGIWKKKKEMNRLTTHSFSWNSNGNINNTDRSASVYPAFIFSDSFGCVRKH